MTDERLDRMEAKIDRLAEAVGKLTDVLLATRAEMATKEELAALRAEMATKEELATLRAEMATKEDIARLEYRLDALELVQREFQAVQAAQEPRLADLQAGQDRIESELAKLKQVTSANHFRLEGRISQVDSRIDRLFGPPPAAE